MTGLEALGLEEVEPWLVEDTLRNRTVLKENGYGVQDEWDENGDPLGLLRVVDPERLVESNRLRFRWILKNEKDMFSDFVNVEDMDDEQAALVPHWVVKQARRRREWLDEMAEAGVDGGSGALVLEAGADGEERAGVALARGREVPVPGRCVHKKIDGSRCWGWSPRRDGEERCRVHSGAALALTQSGAAVGLSRSKLMLAAPAMADELIGLAYTATKDDGVRVRAVTEALDRAGVRPTSELNLNVSGTVEHVDGAAIVRDRLEELAKRMAPVEVESEIVEGEVVGDDDEE